MNLGSEGLKVGLFQIWAWVWPISSQTGSKFGHFGGVRVGSKFGFVDEPGFGRVRSSVFPD